ncbi:MAG TPA: YbjN domain-containing protein [Microvirga sp.]|nr:YbjN domain-containing protein [Microvirga sp.]
MFRLASCLAAGLIGSLTLASAVRAESAPAEMFTTITADQAANLIRDIGYRAEVISPVSETIHRVRTRIGGREAHVLLYSCKPDKCLSMQIRTTYAKTDGYDLTVANDWNYNKRFLKVYLDDEENINADMDIMVLGGITAETLKEYLNVFEDLTREIHTHFQSSRKAAAAQPRASADTGQRRWR